MGQNQAVIFYFAHLDQHFAVLHRKMQTHTLTNSVKSSCSRSRLFQRFPLLSMGSTKQYQGHRPQQSISIFQILGREGEGREKQMKQLRGAQQHRPDHRYNHSRFVLPPTITMIQDYLHVKNITVSWQYCFFLS